MEKTNFITKQQHEELIQFTVFEPKGDDKPAVRKKTEEKLPVDRQLEVRIDEVFGRRKVLEGLGVYDYKFNLITGSVFKKKITLSASGEEQEHYYKAFDSSLILKDSSATPQIELIPEKDARKKTFHKKDEINVNFMSKFFPFFSKVEKNKCAELIIRDEALSICGTENIDKEKWETIWEDLRKKPVDIKDYYYVENIITASVEQDIMDEVDIKKSLDGVYIKIEGGYYSSNKESKREIKICAILIPIDEVILI